MKHSGGWIIITGLALLSQAGGIEIEVDYRYDTNHFFDPGTTQGQQARAALEAAAARYSRVITTGLGAVTVSDGFFDPRISFIHPGTGEDWQVSSAASAATDALAGVSIANEYRGAWSLDENVWVLYAGAMPLGSAAIGGTGAGLNFGSVFDDSSSILNRGFNSGYMSLPVWGGAVSFDSSGATDWHFDHLTTGDTGQADFYSVALHEIGHVLGLGPAWNEWAANTVPGELLYIGAEALAMYEIEHGLPLPGLDLDASLQHWADDTYQSGIFAPGAPNYTGTVGPAGMQNLLMDPSFDFGPDTLRFELTNLEAAALRDIGWTVIPESSMALMAVLAAASSLLCRRKA